MSQRAPRRYRTAAGTARRQPRVRRASAGLSPTRSGALLAMLVTAGALYGLATTSAFGFGRLEIEGASLTAEDAIRAKIGLPGGTNLVGLATEPIAARIRQLTSIRDAEVSIGLPDAIRVIVDERRPVVVWAVAERRFLIDGTGLVFAETTGQTGDAAQTVPIVIDERATASALSVSSVLDPIDLDAATRLGSLTPAQVGSHAALLRVHITDDRGFTISSGNGGWVAVFGFYVGNQRPPALIPGQVQLLSGLLAGREDTVQTVILADEREGTFTAKPTPRPSTSPGP